MKSTLDKGNYRTGEFCLYSTDRTMPLAATRRGCIFAHGAGGSAEGDDVYPFNLPLIATARAGYPIVAPDLCAATYQDASGGGWNFGNSDAVAATAAAATALGVMGAKTDKVILVGGSMGAATVLNYYKANPTKVLAIALTIPLLDFNDAASSDKGFVSSTLTAGVTSGAITLAVSSGTGFSAATGVPGIGAGTGANKVNLKLDNGSWISCTLTSVSGNNLTVSGVTGTASIGALVTQGYGATLVNAYGVAWPSQLSGAQIAANSPIAWTEIAGALTVPVTVWASDNDPIASNTTACQTWAAAVAAAGGGNVTPTVNSLGAVGHNGNSVDPLAVVRFFDANGGRA